MHGFDKVWTYNRYICFHFNTNDVVVSFYSHQRSKDGIPRKVLRALRGLVEPLDCAPWGPFFL